MVPVALLVALRLGWLSWLVADGGPVRKTLEALSWIAALVAVGFSVFELRRQRPEPVVSRSVYVGRALHLDGDRLPRVADVSLLALRVKRAVGTSDGQALPRYVPRDRDEDLEWAIAGGGLVLLHGRAAAGKSRAAAEAVRRLRPDHELLVPVDGPALRRIVESGQQLSDTVVWLDDLERFLVPGGLDVGLLQQLAPPGSPVCVVATIRDNELAAFRTTEGAINQAGTDLITAIPPSHLIVIKQHLTEAEQERARVAQASDPRVGRALAAPEGFAEYLAAGTSMLERWSIGDNPLFHVGQALISAAVDCRRAGYADAVPGATLAELHRPYLPAPWCDRPDLPPVAEGLAWAARPVLGASSCLQPRTGGTYLVSDYLVDLAQEGTSPLAGAPIPDGTWEVLFRLCSDQSVVALGFGAYRADRFEVAEKCFRRACEAGDGSALGLVAIAIGKLGRLAEVRKIFEDAARSGDRATMLRAALSLSFNDWFDDMLDLGRRNAEAGNRYAFLSLANCLVNSRRWDDLQQLALYTIDHNLPDMVSAVMASITKHIDEDRLVQLACHAVDSHNEDVIISTLVNVNPDSALTSRLLQHAMRSGNTSDEAAILAWLAHDKRFGEIAEFTKTALLADEEDMVLTAIVPLAKQEGMSELMTLAREAIDSDDVDSLQGFAVGIKSEGRRDRLEELLQYSEEVASVGSREFLNMIIALDNASSGNEEPGEQP
ncbi:hypothetical protein [Amycolatopsis sp. NPDC004625]|uniref:hypothetical protein n=1 Tax=Amycolatopsis sp. NPDC004625 TaxID=3154670 RepID=UPI0033BE324E